MAWYYYTRTGKLYHNDKYIAKGYSGSSIGLNNPNFQWLKDIGPIPPGKYSISGPINSAKTGPYVLELKPDGHQALGRAAFQIHGDNKNLNYSASSGCIILGKKIREQIIQSGDLDLVVIGVRMLKV